MKGEVDMTSRNIAIYILLTIITCGIFGIYWFIVLHEDINNAAQEPVSPSGGVAVILTIVTCGIYGLYWAYKMGEKLDKACTMRGIPTGSRSIVYLVLSIFGLSIVAYALMQDTLNKFPDTQQTA